MNNIKYIIFSIAALICVCLLITTSCGEETNDDPLSSCTPATVEQVVINYGTTSYSLDTKELAAFFTLLGDLGTFTPDETLLGVDGDDFWSLKIQLKSGDQLFVDVSSPYVVVDGNGYKVDEDACTNLQHYIQGIVNTKIK
jgi:hypothetical protein